jgi:hypothetical protein
MYLGRRTTWDISGVFDLGKCFWSQSVGSGGLPDRDVRGIPGIDRGWILFRSALGTRDELEMELEEV